MLPALQKLGEKEKQQGKKRAEISRSLGFSQAFEYGEHSNLEYVSRDIDPGPSCLTVFLFSRTRIAALQNQVIKLASRVDTPISQPPTS